MAFNVFVAIAFGGSLGALARYGLTSLVHNSTSSDWPWGTLLVNAIGSLLIGVLTVWFLHKSPESAQWRLFWITGLLGSFTTYSTFSMQTVELLMNGAYLGAVGNIAANLLTCLIACFLGLWLARLYWPLAS